VSAEDFHLVSADLAAAAILNVDSLNPTSSGSPSSIQNQQKRARQEQEVDKLLQWEADNVRFLKKKRELQQLQREREQLTVELQQTTTAGTWSVSSQRQPNVSGSSDSNPPPTVLIDPVTVRDQPTQPQLQSQSTAPLPAIPTAPSLDIPGSGSDNTASTTAPSLTVSDLRNLSTLQPQVDSHLKFLGWQAAAALDPLPESIKGKLKPTSGRSAKPDTNISKEILWPHSAIEVQFTGTQFSYDQLDFPLLAAGEIAIVLDPKVSAEERGGRLHLLKTLAYYSRTRQWSDVRSLHSAVLNQIEQNQRSWTDKQFSELASNVFLTNPGQHTGKQLSLSAQSGPARVHNRGNRPFQKRGRAASGPPSSGRSVYKVDRFFCSDFNQGICPHKDAHLGRLGESDRWLEHFCASCYLEADEYNMHAEIQGCARYDPSKPRKSRK
jgi:hypothetical protein